MYFQQSELFKGLDESFVKEFTDIGEKETYNAGHKLFLEGDSAGRFFVLLEGSVRISIGETGHTVYSVDQPGEVFGWSSLVGRDNYSASAECREKTMLLKIDVGTLNNVLERDAVTGMLFFKRLAGVLGNRLLQTYKLMSDTAGADISRSYGTGQVLESDTKAS
jgi:CRP/FNR family cyclic AMP-dependent transcriptional regulator